MNMIKFQFLFLFISACLSNAYCQESLPADQIPHEKHQRLRKLPFHAEAGINLLQMARVVKNTTTDSSGLNPWLIDGRIGFRKWGIRGSAGGSYRHSQNYLEGFRDSETLNQYALNWRAGLSYRSKFGNRFYGDFSIDWVSNFVSDRQITDSGFDKIDRINQSSLTGGGMSCAAGYSFTKRLSVKFELSFYYMTGERETARKFINFPELNDQLSTIEISELRTPAAIFLTFKI